VKLGTESRKETIAAAVLGAVALLMLVRTFTSSTPPAAQAASEPTPTAATQQAQRRSPRAPAARRAAPGQGTAVLAPSADPRLKLDLLKSSEQTEYAGNGRNIFRAEAEPPPIPQPVQRVTKEEPTGPPPPPPPPPITLRFFGYANKPGEPKRVFLADGDEVFVAGEGDLVNRRYKVLRIGNNTVDIQDILNNNTQTLALQQPG
jgi:hypothetical protein